MAMPGAFGRARNEGIADFEAGENEGTLHRRRSFEPLLEDSVQLVAELAPEAGRIRVQRRTVQSASRPLPLHFLDSGNSRCARAASTWSARRRASARAVARPWAVIR